MDQCLTWTKQYFSLCLHIIHCIYIANLSFINYTLKSSLAFRYKYISKYPHFMPSVPVDTKLLSTINRRLHNRRSLYIDINLYQRSAVDTYDSRGRYREFLFLHSMLVVDAPLLSKTNTTSLFNRFGFPLLSVIDDKANDYLSVGEAGKVSSFFKTNYG